MRSSPSNVGVFLGFGNPQLGQSCLRHHLAQGIGDVLRRENRRHQFVEVRRIRRQAGGRAKRRASRPIEAVEVGVQHRRQNLAHPVGAKVCHHQAVAVPHPGAFAHHRRQDKLIAGVGGVGRVHDAGRVGRLRAFRIDDRVVGQRHAVPSVVAIHRVVAPAHRRDPYLRVVGNGLFQVGDEARGATRRGVPAIEDGVDIDGEPGCC
jgi:hypothetical protein